MRIPIILFLAIVPALAQVPLVQLLNASRPGRDLQVGDRFQVVISAAPHQPVSVRTMGQGRIDWSPVIGTADSTGRWSTAGQFEKKDFGSWAEIWTVGGKLASPALQFWVNPPCLPDGQGMTLVNGLSMILQCETAEGLQTFAAPSPDAFRTPDGRLVASTPLTPQEQYHSELLQHFMASGMGATPVALQSSRGGLGDETADLISKLIGVNALKEEETRNSLALFRAAFAKPESIQPTAKEPTRTLLLLHHLEDITDPGPLKREVTETIAYFQRNR